MICQHCGGLVTWRGPLVDLTHTECEGCGATNCQVPDDHPQEEDDMAEMIQAPFDDDTREKLRDWQACGWAHPLTCGCCNSALPMIPEKRGLVCPSCFHVQEKVPAVCLTTPDNPAAILAANESPVDESR